MSAALGRWAAAVVAVGSRAGEVARLAQGWARFHDRPLYWVVADGAPVAAPAPGVVLAAPDEVGVEDDELTRLLTCHGAAELEATIRPAAVRWVLDGAGGDPSDAVLCVPADAEVGGPLVSLVEAAGPSGLALVPARHGPVPRDGRLPDEVDIAALGRFDQQLFALAGAGGREVSGWWRERLIRSPHLDPARLVLPTRPWLDDAAASFPATIVRSPGLCYAYWNGDEEDRNQQQAAVVRFAGFVPQEPWRYSVRAGDFPRILLSDHPPLASACRSRAEFLLNYPAPPYRGNVLPGSGVVLDEAMRLAYARGLLVAAGRSHREPPNPFRPGQEALFVEWLNGADAGDATTRYLLALWQLRPDLQRAFPDPRDSTGGGLGAWARIRGRREGLWYRLIPDDDRRPDAFPASSSRTDGSWTDELRTDGSRAHGWRPDGWEAEIPAVRGINLVGLFRAEFGIGEAARLLQRTIAAAGVAHVGVLHTATLHRQEHPLDVGSLRTADEGPAPYDVNVVVLNADALGGFVAEAGPRFFAGRKTVGVWFWEVEVFPERYWPAFALVDEIWVASCHVQAAIVDAAGRAGLQTPVFVVPLGARPREPAPPLPDALRTRLPDDRFIYAFSFDYASVAERKNPWGLIAAFRLAFPEPRLGPRAPLLVIKTMSGGFHPLDRERLLAAAGDAPDIVIIEDELSVGAHAALLQRADCYVSLHRAEGWGLTMAEAMGAGRPVIATAYSGNLEFMTPENSWLIPFRLAPIPTNLASYPGGGRWAEPDLGAAALAMRQVRDRADLVAIRSAQAAVDIDRMASNEEGVAFVRERLGALAQVRDPTQSHEEPAQDEEHEVPTPDPIPAQPSGAATEPPADAHDPLEGLGPVVLSDPPSAHEARGARRAAQRAVARAIQFETDRRDARDHLRDVEMAALLGETRRTVRGLADEVQRQGEDLSRFTSHVTAAIGHLHALQDSHDAVTAGQGTMHGQLNAADASLRERLDVSLSDLSGDIRRLEARVAGLATIIERLAPRSD